MRRFFARFFRLFLILFVVSFVAACGGSGGGGSGDDDPPANTGGADSGGDTGGGDTGGGDTGGGDTGGGDTGGGDTGGGDTGGGDTGGGDTGGGDTGGGDTGGGDTGGGDTGGGDTGGGDTGGGDTGGGDTGGGDTGGGDTGGGNTNTTNSVLLYRSGSISMINPSTPSTPPVLLEAANTTNELDFLHGTLDSANSRVTNLHTPSVIYGNIDDGRIYKIDTREGAVKSPTQVSNETQAADICFYDFAFDLANHNDSVYLYELPGDDANCNGENEWKFVRIGMGPNDSPLPALPIETFTIDVTSGAITGFLAIDNDKLVHCDHNFENCSDVTTFTNYVEVLEESFLAEDSLIIVDNELRHYNDSTRNLSSPLHTFSLYTSDDIIHTESDSSHAYFSEGNKIYKIPLDGSANSTLLTSDTGSIEDLNLTKNHVLYSYSPFFGLEGIKSISKSGGSPIILSDASMGSATDPDISGDYVYFTKTTLGGSGPSFVATKADGSELKETQGAMIAGGILSSEISADGWDAAKILWLDNCDTNSCAGSKLIAIDATTNSNPVELGTMPLDIEFIWTLGVTNRILGIGMNSIFENDIFFLDTEQANSLQRITTTPGIDEDLIGF